MKIIKTKLKKFLSVLLTLSICIPMIPVSASAAREERYSVLVLDTSEISYFYQNDTVIYTAEPAIAEIKEGAKKFINDSKSAKGENYIALIEFKGNNAYVVQDFTNDTDLLLYQVDTLECSEKRASIAKGLNKAKDLLSKITNKEAIKNVVLFTTGESSTGAISYDGKYNSGTVGSKWRQKDENIPLYAYANVAYNAARELKKTGATIYSIGYFERYKDMPSIGDDIVAFYRLFASDLATDFQYFYEVNDLKDIEFTFGEVSGVIHGNYIEGTFNYPGKYELIDGEGKEKMVPKDYEASYKYSDSYFMDSAYNYNSELAFMSMCLAWSAFGSNATRSPDELEKYGPDYSKYSQNVEKLLTEIGFEDVTPNKYYNVKPITDSVGAIAGHKTINDGEKDYTLIALAIRGGGYESEWSSNVTLGKSGQHQGFEEARDIVLDFLKDYVKDNNIRGDVKLWITGYSRAAATTNLTAGELDKNAKSILGRSINLMPENIYAYCLEAPQGTLTTIDNNDELYDNIFSIINPVDIVTKVAMKEFYFTHFGEQYRLPTNGIDANYKEKRDKMLEIYYSLENTETYMLDSFTALKMSTDNMTNETTFVESEVSMIDYLDNLLRAVSNEVLKTRENYVSSFQSLLREICYLFFGVITSDPVKVEFFTECIEENLKLNILPIIWCCSTGDSSKLSEVICNIIYESATEAEITDLSEKEITSLAADLTELIIKFMPQWYKLATLISNAKVIGNAHHPELCYAWLASEVDIETNGDYRVIHINCPVDVSVYDSTNTLVSRIKDNKPVELYNDSNYTYINFDDTKVVVLPVNESYRVEITVTDTGEVDVSVKEFCADIGTYSSLKNYYDIPITVNESLTLQVPEISTEILSNSTANGTGTVYSLFDANNNEIKESISLSGEKVKNAYFTVNVTKNIAEAGAVAGSGSKQVGEYTKLEAFPADGYVFNGWYENKTLLSENTEVRIRVESDRNIEARFIQTCADNISDSSDNKPTDSSINKEENNKPTFLLITGTALFLIAILFFVSYTKKKKGNKE